MLTKQEFAEGVRRVMVSRVHDEAGKDHIMHAKLVTGVYSTRDYGVTENAGDVSPCITVFDNPDMPTRRQYAYALMHELCHVWQNEGQYPYDILESLFDRCYTTYLTHPPAWMEKMHSIGLYPWRAGHIRDISDDAYWLDKTLWPEIEALGPVEGLS